MDLSGREPQTPNEWIDHLTRQIHIESAETRRYDEYYEGNHPLAFAQVKFREAFGGMFQGQWADNFCALVVDSVAERLQVEGFRLTEDPKADRDAADIWQRSGMDADSDAAHTDALIQRRAYVHVWADADGKPTITPYSAHEMTLAYVPGSRRTRRVALKRQVDEWGTEHVALMTAKSVYTTSRPEGRDKWDDGKPAKNPLGVVPVIALDNRPRLNRKPMSELHRIIPLQDAVNKVMIDALVASEMGAFPMRWVTGLELAEEDGKTAPPPFKVALDKMLHSEDPNTKFGQFETVDLANYVRLIDALTTHIASVSRIPTHYFLLQAGQPPSGESIKSAEAGLVAKVLQRQRCFGEAWEEVIRLAFAVLKDPRQNAHSAEVIWRDPEYRTEGEHVDALLKKKTFGVPDRQLQEDAGYTPAQIERFPQLRDEQAKEARDRAERFGPPVVPGESQAPAAPGAEDTQGDSRGSSRHLGEAA
ncbi:phage portal protein [Streptosporangium sp. OZ121]|uniref:phage portal protein n=1 Tax=Streptosporangium sp. OZ121 TaxID=3444183 RepID=UPI003F7A466E